MEMKKIIKSVFEWTEKYIMQGLNIISPIFTTLMRLLLVATMASYLATKDIYLNGTWNFIIMIYVFSPVIRQVFYRVYNIIIKAE